MARTIKNKLLPVLFALLLFPSCDKDEYGQEENTGGGSKQIRFEIAVETATATSSGVQTRVATSTDGNYTSTWNNGDEIGIYIVKGSGGLQASGNWVDNMKMTYNNGSWTPVFPSGKEYYPTDGDKLSFYAYYPYNSAVTNALNMTIPGLTDQSSAANLSKSDLLSAFTPNVGKSSTPVQLEFSHALTMVELSVTGGAGAQISSEVAVTLEGCVPNTSFNLSTRAANASGNAASVKMYRVEQSGDANYLTKYTYRALVPTQTVFAGTELFRFSQTQGTITRALSHRPSSNVALYPEQVKPYNIALQIQTSGITYNVGDYYPKNGFPILGIVFEITDGVGYHGKMISLDLTGNAAWGPRNVDQQAQGVGGIRSVSDGLTATKNMIIKYKDTPDFSTLYGAFHWIYQTKNHEDVNGIWYMPAKDEVLAFWNVWNTDQTGFNSKLTAAGGIGVYGYWWTSTESNANFCHFIGTPWGAIWDYTYFKDYVNWEFLTRPIAKF